MLNSTNRLWKVEVNKMKEITYEDWQKKPTPRMMWVWDDNKEDKVKRKVVHFFGILGGELCF